MANVPRRLVIVESPTKATMLTRFLGSGYVVESSRGHIRDLPTNASEVPAKYKGLPWARLGVDVIDLHDQECIDLLGGYIRANPEVWNEDIGED